MLRSDRSIQPVPNLVVNSMPRILEELLVEWMVDSVLIMYPCLVDVLLGRRDCRVRGCTRTRGRTCCRRARWSGRQGGGARARRCLVAQSSGKKELTMVGRYRCDLRGTTLATRATSLTALSVFFHHRLVISCGCVFSGGW